ncbi:hypothetical protein [Ammoniphilus resinae]|uniref:Uncharacterized protein n=1 Tax=Ammoniphilus resinae TaxID=861532 RepID=A0ABS4GX63_9BACL|nr:hypothetical protein [Ammoniphilus resinae]MBP1934858.1 hypothetical protein [Ammoniphilus resinae]
MVKGAHERLAVFKSLIPATGSSDKLLIGVTKGRLIEIQCHGSNQGDYLLCVDERIVQYVAVHT